MSQASLLGLTRFGAVFLEELSKVQAEYFFVLDEIYGRVGFNKSAISEFEIVRKLNFEY